MLRAGKTRAISFHVSLCYYTKINKCSRGPRHVDLVRCCLTFDGAVFFIYATASYRSLLKLIFGTGLSKDVASLVPKFFRYTGYFPFVMLTLMHVQAEALHGCFFDV